MTERDYNILSVFTAAMRSELDNNAWKGGWGTTTKGHRAWQVFYHALKLVAVAMEDEPSLIALREFAADTANEAMLVADNAGALDPSVGLPGTVTIITKVTEPAAFNDAVQDLEEWMRKHFNVSDEDLIPESQQPQAKDQNP